MFYLFIFGHKLDEGPLEGEKKREKEKKERRKIKRERERVQTTTPPAGPSQQ